MLDVIVIDNEQSILETIKKLGSNVDKNKLKNLINKKFTKDNFKVIESDKELNLNLDEYKLFSKLITNFLNIKFFWYFISFN